MLKLKSIATIIIITMLSVSPLSANRPFLKIVDTVITAAAVPYFVSSSYHFYKKHTHSPETEPLRAGTEHDFTSNNVLYKEIAQQFHKVATVPTRYQNEYLTKKVILDFCHVLLNQRYVYWKSNLDSAPLYIKLHDKSSIPLPSKKLNVIELIDNPDITARALVNYAGNSVTNPVSRWQKASNRMKKHLRIGKIIESDLPGYLETHNPYKIEINSRFLDKPTYLLWILLHEVTHLEQYNNALALNTHLKNKYGIELNWFHPFYVGYTNKSSNRIYESIENDFTLQTLNLPNVVGIKSYGLKPERKLSLLELMKAKRFAKVRSLFTRHNLYNLEAEADRSMYYFVHNPYLLDKHFELQTPHYSSKLSIDGYDPDRKGSIAKYAQYYYMQFPERENMHKKEYVQQLRSQLEEIVFIENNNLYITKLKLKQAATFLTSGLILGSHVLRKLKK